MKLDKLPDVGKTVMIYEPPLIGFARIYYSEGASNPLPDTGFGRIISFNPSHSTHRPELLEESLANPRAMLLSYFEHGNCQWWVRGEGAAPPDMQWDGTSVAGVWVPGPDNEALSGEILRQAEYDCRLFTAWCNGEVYDMHVTVYTARSAPSGQLLDRLSDYRFDEPLREASETEVYNLDGEGEMLAVLNEMFDE